MIAARRKLSGVIAVAILVGRGGVGREEVKRWWRKRKMVLRVGGRSQYSRSVWGCGCTEDGSSSMPHRAACVDSEWADVGRCCNVGAKKGFVEEVVPGSCSGIVFGRLSTVGGGEMGMPA